MFMDELERCERRMAWTACSPVHQQAVLRAGFMMMDGATSAPPLCGSAELLNVEQSSIRERDQRRARGRQKRAEYWSARSEGWKNVDDRDECVTRIIDGR